MRDNTTVSLNIHRQDLRHLSNAARPSAFCIRPAYPASKSNIPVLDSTMRREWMCRQDNPSITVLMPSTLPEAKHAYLEFLRK
jgi:hypothetical protein